MAGELEGQADDGAVNSHAQADGNIANPLDAAKVDNLCWLSCVSKAFLTLTWSC